MSVKDKILEIIAEAAAQKHALAVGPADMLGIDPLRRRSLYLAEKMYLHALCDVVSVSERFPWDKDLDKTFKEEIANAASLVCTTTALRILDVR